VIGAFYQHWGGIVLNKKIVSRFFTQKKPAMTAGFWGWQGECLGGLFAHPDKFDTAV
jgi:hypothetical protein